MECLGNPNVLNRIGLKELKVLKRAFLLRQQWIERELHLLHIKFNLFVACSTIVGKGGSFSRKIMKGSVVFKEHNLPRNALPQTSFIFHLEGGGGSGAIEEKTEDKLGLLEN